MLTVVLVFRIELYSKEFNRYKVLALVATYMKIIVYMPVWASLVRILKRVALEVVVVDQLNTWDRAPVLLKIRRNRLPADDIDYPYIMYWPSGVSALVKLGGDRVTLVSNTY